MIAVQSSDVRVNTLGGLQVVFEKSNLAYQSFSNIFDFAEAHYLTYSEEPLLEPEQGKALIRCSTPLIDITLGF
jgi:hypothetical protein